LRNSTWTHVLGNSLHVHLHWSWKHWTIGERENKINIFIWDPCRISERIYNLYFSSEIVQCSEDKWRWTCNELPKTCVNVKFPKGLKMFILFSLSPIVQCFHDQWRWTCNELPRTCVHVEFLKNLQMYRLQSTELFQEKNINCKSFQKFDMDLKCWE
jgi:hypothetical protein